jgi:hypothetical protein
VRACRSAPLHYELFEQPITVLNRNLNRDVLHQLHFVLMQGLDNGLHQSLQYVSVIFEPNAKFKPVF